MKRRPLTRTVRTALWRSLRYYDACLESYGEEFEGLSGTPAERDAALSAILAEQAAAATWLNSVEQKAKAGARQRAAARLRRAAADE